MRARQLLLPPLILLSLSVLSTAQTWSGILAPARAENWASNAGVVGGIPDVSWTQCGSTIAPYGTANGPASGSTISNAINACPAHTYVLLGPGNFYISDGILIRASNVVLRGSGPTQTTIYFSGHQSCGGFLGAVCVWNGDGLYNDGVDNAANWTGGYTQGATTITLSANTTGSTRPFVGATLFLDQLVDGTARTADTGNVFTCSTSPACTESHGGNGRPSRNQQQLVTVTSVSGSGPYTVGITPGLYMPNWRSAQSPAAWWGNMADVAYVGVEDVQLNFSNDGGLGGNGIQFLNAESSWVKNTTLVARNPEPVTNDCTYRLIEGYQSHNLTFRDSYLVGRKCWDDYGTDFWEGGDSLIENNIFQWEAIPNNRENAQGNVYSYNFTVSNYWGNPGGTWAQGSFYHHGSFDSFTLAEGNIGYSLEEENYFGQAFFDTAFRNRFTGWQNTSQSNQTVPAFIYGLDRYQNIVGNILGTAGYHTQYEIAATGNTTHSGSGSCNNTVVVMGLGGACADGDGSSYPYNDATTPNTVMLWGNLDVVNAANRFVASEDGSGGPAYPALSNPSSTLAPSFLYGSAPAWWPSSKPWPAIGPDVSGGNLGVCSGGTYDKWPATASSQCTGGTLVSAGINGEAYSNPAMDCYFTLGGAPDGTGNVLAFDASKCYGSGTTQGQPPAAPTGLNATVQ